MSEDARRAEPLTTAEKALKAAAGAMERHCDDLGIEMPSPGLARALATVAAPPIAAAERERVATGLDAIADRYKNAGVFAACIVDAVRKLLAGEGSA